MAGELRIRPVRRYRRAHYPSRWRPWGGPARRARRGAALLVLPVGLGAACSDSTGDGGEPISHRLYLTRAEGLAVLDRVVGEADWSRTDSCPTVAERFQPDALFEWTPGPGETTFPVTVGLDLLAPTEEVAPSAGCAGGHFPAVGLGLLPPWEDEGPLPDYSAWLDGTERASLPYLESSGQAALGVFDISEFGYSDPAYASSSLAAPYATREDAEAALETAIRNFIVGLRGEGFI